MVAALSFVPSASVTSLGPVTVARCGEDLDLVAVEDVGVDALEPLDLGEHVVAQGRPVELAARRPSSRSGRVLQILGEMGAVDEQLLRHAAADHAGAADLIFLGDGDRARHAPPRPAPRARRPIRRR